MSKANKKNGRRTIAIEICHTAIDLAVLEQSRDGKATTVRTRSIVWREESRTLYGEQGLRELSAALKTLIAKERLTGCKAQVALSGDYCVTRVVAGGADRVRSEMRQLEERSNLYLSLGPGAKSVAGAVRQIDVRHQQAWLSATNKKTLDVILKAAEAASIEVDVVEPSLIALCRALGAMGVDQEAPVLVIEVDEQSVELGLCYRGRLLLDHRPAGIRGADGLAQIVDQHLERLQRYCTRHFRYASGKIAEVYLCGSEAIVEKLAGDFTRGGSLVPRKIDPRKVSNAWQFENDEIANNHTVVLGTALGAGLSNVERNGPNLMERLRGELREPLLKGLLQTAWPIAAALLLAIGLYAADLVQSFTSEDLQRQLEALKPADDEVRKMKAELASAEVKVRELKHLAAGVRPSNWETVITQMSHCMPEDVWLDALTVDSRGKMTVSGNSFSEEGVFEFVRWLNGAPTLRKVALQSTKPIEARTGPATHFDVRCDLTEGSDQASQEKRDG